jgi:DNA integrity scanning protein DisA with diadenylate cyclase activity
MATISIRISEKVYNKIEYLKYNGIDFDSEINKYIINLIEETKGTDFNIDNLIKQISLSERRYKKDLNAESQKRWQKRNRDLNKIKCKEYKRNNKEKVREYVLKYRKENRLKINEYMRKRYRYLRAQSVVKACHLDNFYKAVK